VSLLEERRERERRERVLVLSGYLTCAFWSSTTGEDSIPLDRDYAPTDLAPEAREAMAAEVRDFVELLDREGVDWRSEMDAERLGFDFWLTRNGHGAGFWDRGLGALGDRLTELAKAAGESDLYVGDDGQVWVSP
jgi:hypothetical protein